MKMIIEHMRLENFKGCRELDIDFSSRLTAIRGMNGCGKTTIADAFTWVLFNKDSRGNAPGGDAFHEKPLDEFSHEIHNLDTSVTLNCTLDGQRFDLRRTQTENWVKKRGNAEATFQGNVSTYWINGVETRLSDFRQRIAAIADEEVFRLVGSLSAFNALEWKKRRAQLMALAGKDVDGELLARPEYRPIADEIAQRNITPDELRKVLLDQRRRIGDELRMIPVRIDEAKKSLPGLTDQQIRDAEFIVADSKRDIARIDESIAALRAGGSAGPTQQQKLALEQEIVSIKRRMWDELASATRIAKAEADSAGEALRRLTNELQQAKTFALTYQAKAERAAARRDELREKFIEARKQTLDLGEALCPTCGQPMPAEMIERAKARFEATRRAMLDDIKRQGQEAAQEAQKAEEDRQRQTAEADALEARVREAQEAHEAAMRRVKDLPVEPDFAGEDRLNELLKQRDAAEAVSGDSSAELEGLNRRKRELEALVDKHSAVLAARDAAVETEARIKAHEARLSEVGAQLTETEQMIILAEQFVQARCGALENSINSRFPTVRWKLFDRQINGGIADCCECLIPCGGAMVTYSSANTAAQINADIEIVNVLSAHYDVEVPLFVDNSERVNALAPTETQLITLSVSTDDHLTIERSE